MRGGLARPAMAESPESARTTRAQLVWRLAVTADRPEKITADYGSGMTSTDEMIGGKSKASFEITQPGANGSKGGLKISGEIVAAGGQFTWAGAVFRPRSAPHAAREPLP